LSTNIQVNFFPLYTQQKQPALVRGRQPRTSKGLGAAPGDSLEAVTLNDIDGWVRHCGY